MSKQCEEKKKVKILELDIVRSLSRHGIPFEYVNCLQALLKKHCQDDLTQKMNLHSTKAAYLATNRMWKSHEEETVDLLEQCTAFAIGFNKSEVNKTSEFEILVKIATTDNKVMLRHYNTMI